ncbi:hypothetical protein M2132_001292 [Dysgonomonas sp. PH5-45]|uniref:T9SS type A sorting domain-containing protein n=1 Tax=unclassified Dysgonomonas TaxID=2630389 RepID=UPI00247714D9|nr:MULTISPECIES: T9SS type A sorting domain-containing protein [unclassified Dysgonomonas]MDH6354957.1 hypothetical protein [Dysgonomonas sp. PH5-45]MDH6387856.1 hypothetical protein [Dysgonomonas sp. PH5-37]
MKKHRTLFNVALLKSRRFLLLFLMILSSGAILKAAPIVQGFNDYSIQTWNGTFQWSGWSFVNGRGYTMQKHEGTHSVAVYGSLTSPEKTGGIGLINFMYRTESGGAVDVKIQTSSDGDVWNDENSFTASGTTFQSKTVTVNSAVAKYVRLSVVDGASYSKTLLVDALVITDNGGTIAEVDIANEYIFGFETLPFTGNIPMSFTGVSSDVTFTTNKASDISFTTNPLPAGEAVGSKNIPITFNPANNTVNAFYSTLTVSGGGIPFGPTVPVYFYRLQESSFEDFDKPFVDAAVGASGTKFTGSGWLVKGGSYYTNNSAYIGFGSTASVSLSSYGTPVSLTSPMMKSGIGTVQFYAHTGTNKTTVINLKMYVSVDGINWVEKETIAVNPTINVFKAFDVVVNDATAKFVKIELASGSCYFENITITKNGVSIPKVSVEAEPYFASPVDVERTENIKIKGENITSDLTVEFVSGGVFSSATQTIPAASINNATYTLPVKFKPTSGANYFTDNIRILDSDSRLIQSLSVEGYALKDLLSEQFNITTFPEIVGLADAYMCNGWKMFKGTRVSGSSFSDGVSYPNFVSSPSAVQLNTTTSVDSRLVSPPKSNGVGTIQFYYRNTSTSNPNNNPVLKVRTYKDMAEAPTPVASITVPLFSESPDFTLFEVQVNDENARFVEIYSEIAPLGNLNVIIDNVVVTAANKGVPAVSVPENIALKTYPGEQLTYDFDIDMQNVYGDVSLSLKKGSDFALTPVSIVPVDGAASVTGQLVYTPSDTEFMSVDSIVIQGEGLTSTIVIPVIGYKLERTISQNFNATGWGSPEGTYVLDGWEMTYATRMTNPAWIKGAAGLSLNYNSTKTGVLTSPEKVGGIKDISFSYYHFYPHTLAIEVSEDGKTWTEVYSEEVEFGSIESETIQVNKPNAKFARFFIKHQLTTAQTFSIYLDDITITGYPYLRQVGTAEAVETNTIPVQIPVQIAGDIDVNATITMAAADSKFTPSATTITPADLTESGAPKNFDLQLSFTATESGVYEDAIVIKDADNVEYLRVPVKVTYNKPYIELSGTVDPVETNTVPVTVPVKVAGLLTANASIAMAAADSKFTPSATTITPADLVESGTPKDFSFQLSFTATESGVYEDAIVIKDADNAEYLRVPVKVTYNKPYLELSGTVDPVETNTVPVTVPVKVAGLLTANASITMAAADSKFTPSATTITPADLAESGTPKDFSFQLSFTATESGVYEDAIVIKDADNAEYLRVPVKVTYNKPYLELLGTIEPVETTESPIEIPIEVKGLLASNVTIQLSGADADNFSLGKTSITPNELKEGSVYFDLTFTSEASGEYNVDVVFGEYLTIPVKVTYRKPYLELVGTVDPVNATTLPVNIPVEIKGFMAENATITLTGEHADNFQLSATGFTPADLEAGTVKFSAIFTLPVDENGEYKANIVIADSKSTEYLTIPLAVNYVSSGIYEDGVNGIWVYVSKDGMLHVRNAEVGSLLTIFNLNGQAQMNAKINSEHESFVLDLEKGVYIVNIGQRNFKISYR